MRHNAIFHHDAHVAASQILHAAYTRQGAPGPGEGLKDRAIAQTWAFPEIIFGGKVIPKSEEPAGAECFFIKVNYSDAVHIGIWSDKSKGTGVLYRLIIVTKTDRNARLKALSLGHLEPNHLNQALVPIDLVPEFHPDSLNYTCATNAFVTLGVRFESENAPFHFSKRRRGRKLAVAVLRLDGRHPIPHLRG